MFVAVLFLGSFHHPDSLIPCAAYCKFFMIVLNFYYILLLGQSSNTKVTVLEVVMDRITWTNRALTK